MRLFLSLLGLLSTTSKYYAAQVDGNPCDYGQLDPCPGVALYYWQCCKNGEYYACVEGPNGPVIEFGGDTGGNCVPGVVYCDWTNGCDPAKVLPYNSGTGGNPPS